MVAVGLEGVIQGAKPGSVYIDLSTSRPTLIRELEPKFREKGIHVLDAPVSGGKSGAQSRNLAVMVGGDKEVFERVKPLLEAFGDKVFYAGEIGAGSVAKLVHNMIGHGVRQAIAEGMTLGVKAGVDTEALWQCIRRGSLGRMNVLHEGFVRTVFKGEYEPAGFALNLARKDIGLATELAKEFDVPMPIANLSEQLAIQAMNRGVGRPRQYSHRQAARGDGRCRDQGRHRRCQGRQVHHHPSGRVGKDPLTSIVSRQKRTALSAERRSLISRLEHGGLGVGVCRVHDLVLGFYHGHFHQFAVGE